MGTCSTQRLSWERNLLELARVFPSVALAMHEGRHNTPTGVAVVAHVPLTHSSCAGMLDWNVHVLWPSQRSLHNAPIFRLLSKVAVNGKHQCDFVDFCGAYGSHVVTTGCTEKAFATHKASIDVAIARSSSAATRLCINLRLQHLSIRLLHQ